MKKLLSILGFSSLTITPLLAYSGEDAGGAVAMIMGMGLIMMITMLVVTIFFLLAQSSFIDSIKVENEFNNTGKVWIWTQLIPIWAFIAIPVTLSKAKNQFNIYVRENNLENSSNIKHYDSTWGWVWYGGTVVSIFFPIAGIVSLIGIMGFWLHINSVRKSILMVNT
jgi:hypothetical protein